MTEPFVPRQFTDTAGRTWRVSLTAGDLRRVKAAAGVDLGRVIGEGAAAVGDLFADLAAVIDVIYVLAGAADAGVTDEDFARSLAGDALEAAAEALFGAIADFCPSRVRSLLLALATTHRERQAAAVATAGQRLATLRANATGSADSAGSTPAP